MIALVDTSVWIRFLSNRARPSALVGRLRLWTADPRLATLAKELGIAYD